MVAWHAQAPIAMIRRMRTVAVCLTSLLGTAPAAACDLCGIAACVDAKKSEPVTGDAGSAPAVEATHPSGASAGSVEATPDDEPARPGSGGAATQAATRLPSATHPAPPRLGFSAGLIEMYDAAETPRAGSEPFDDPADQYLRTSTTELLLGVHAGRFGVRAYVPYLYLQYRGAVPIGTESGWERGLGDATVEGTALVVRQVDQRSMALVTIIGGVKLPTGDSSELEQEAAPVAGASGGSSHVHGVVFGDTRALVHPHQLALGSGSTDGVIGVSTFTQQERCYGTARLLYDIRTTGRAGYRCGNELEWGGGPGMYLVHEPHGTLGLLANVTGDVRRPDHLDGEQVADTGGAELLIGPDLSATWLSLSAEAGVDFPVLVQVLGYQLTTTWRLHAGVNWSF
jgi:hypothetical protein